MSSKREDDTGGSVVKKQGRLDEPRTYVRITGENERKTSRERPKSAHRSRFKKVKFLHMQKNTFVGNSSILQRQIPYSARDTHKTRKPLFAKLETTEPLKTLKMKKLRNFSKSPVSRIVPKNVKGGTLPAVRGFLNIHSVAKNSLCRH